MRCEKSKDNNSKAKDNPHREEFLAIKSFSQTAIGVRLYIHSFTSSPSRPIEPGTFLRSNQIKSADQIGRQTGPAAMQL